MDQRPLHIHHRFFIIALCCVGLVNGALAESPVRQALDKAGSQITSLGKVVAAWNVGGNDSAKPTISGITFPDDKPGNLTITYLMGMQAVEMVDDSREVAARYSTPDMRALMHDYLRSNWGGGYKITITDLVAGQNYRGQFLFDSNQPALQIFYFGDEKSEKKIGPYNPRNSPTIITIDFIAERISQDFTIAATVDQQGNKYRAILNGLSVTTQAE